jgi:hypothetical protein
MSQYFYKIPMSHFEKMATHIYNGHADIPDFSFGDNMPDLGYAVRVQFFILGLKFSSIFKTTFEGRKRLKIWIFTLS